MILFTANAEGAEVRLVLTPTPYTGVSVEFTPIDPPDYPDTLNNKPDSAE